MLGALELETSTGEGEYCGFWQTCPSVGDPHISKIRVMILRWRLHSVDKGLFGLDRRSAIRLRQPETEATEIVLLLDITG